MANENLRQVLEAKNEEYKGTPYPFGMSGMTMSGYMSSRRGTMFTGNLSQFKNPLNPHFPKAFTNFENMVGKYSSGYRKMRETAEVVAKIYKFDRNVVPDQYNNFLIVFYDPEKDYYWMEKRRPVQKLTENFGYRYNTEVIDSLEVGDRVEKGKILYKSTSYDGRMNYGYGRMATAMHTMDPFIAEDAIVISETLAQEFASIGVITPETSVNDNDLLLNLHGNNELYKPFPDIGEEAKNNIILAKKRIHNNRILHDIKPHELRVISFLNNKVLYGSGRVIDIDILCNKETSSFEPNPFNEQFLKYLTMQDEFYQEVFDIMGTIVESGSDYHRDISYWYGRARDYLDPEFKFRETNGNAFSNYKIKFTLEKITCLSDGQKLVGRYGNKGVVSRILPDDEMPILGNGERVHALLNSLSPTNRLISAPLYELSISFIASRTCECLSTIRDLEEQETFLFDIVSMLNRDQCEELKTFYYRKNDIERVQWMENLIRTKGLRIEVPYLWEDEMLYDRILACYEKYPKVFVPYDVFIKKHGRMYRMMGKYTGYVGEMYLLNLKYTSQKDFSTRSMAFINSRELPSKSDSAKKHQDLYPKTPVKIGYQEILNLLSMVKPRVLAEITMLYRSSIRGRRKLGEKLLTSRKKLRKISQLETFVSRNVEIFNAKFKAMGMKLDFHGELMHVIAYDDRIHAFQSDEGSIFIGNRSDYINFAIREKVEKKYQEDVAVVMGNQEYEDMVLCEVKELRKKLDGFED